jgi:hypothetical protein
MESNKRFNNTLRWSHSAFKKNGIDDSLQVILFSTDDCPSYRLLPNLGGHAKFPTPKVMLACGVEIA